MEENIKTGDQNDLPWLAGLLRRRSHWHGYPEAVMAIKKTAALVLASFSVIAGAHSTDVESAEADVLRIGISYGSFGTVNPNDAGAALKAWVATLSREHKFQGKVQVKIFEDQAKLRQALQDRDVEAASMTAEEFMDSGEQPESIFLTSKQTTFTQQYVVIVPSTGSVTNLSGLKRGRLARHVSPLTSPSLPWLETALAHEQLGRVAELFAEVSPLDNPSRCVLRVFFHQSDACLVTRDAFELACELNPQLRQNLRVLVSSPPLIPTLFFFRSDFPSSACKTFEDAILGLHSTPAGQQVLTVFQGSRMDKQPLASFNDTRGLFNEYRQLLRSKAQTPAATALLRTSP